MSEWIKSILKPIVTEAVSEAVKEFNNKTDEEYYRGLTYGRAKERLEIDQEHEKELYRMFKEGVEHGKQEERAALGVIEEITAEEFDRLTSESAEPTAKTEIPDGFGFVGTIDDLSLALDEEAV